MHDPYLPTFMMRALRVIFNTTKSNFCTWDLGAQVSVEVLAAGGRAAQARYLHILERELIVIGHLFSCPHGALREDHNLRLRPHLDDACKAAGVARMVNEPCVVALLGRIHHAVLVHAKEVARADA